MGPSVLSLSLPLFLPHYVFPSVVVSTSKRTWCIAPLAHSPTSCLDSFFPPNSLPTSCCHLSMFSISFPPFSFRPLSNIMQPFSLSLNLFLSLSCLFLSPPANDSRSYGFLSLINYREGLLRSESIFFSPILPTRFTRAFHAFRNRQRRRIASPNRVAMTKNDVANCKEALGRARDFMNETRPSLVACATNKLSF